MKSVEELMTIKKGDRDTSDDGSAFGDLVRSFVGQGFMLGFGDETEAFVRSLGSDKNYEEIVGDIRNDINTFRRKNPGVAITSEIAGAILPSIAAGFFTGGTGTAAVLGTTAARVAAAAPRTYKAVTTIAPHAALGGTYGAGVSEGGIGDRATNAALSGTISGTLGPVTQKVLPIVGAKARDFINRGGQLTPGQASGNTVVGGALKNLEETLNLFPLLGTQKALDRSMQSFNKIVYNDIAKKINIKIPLSLSSDDIPTYIFNETTKALNKSASGLKITNAKEFNKQIQNIIKSGSAGLTTAEQNVLNRRLIRLTQSTDDVISGTNVQSIDRTLRQLKTSYSTNPDPSSKFILDAVNDIDDLFVRNLSGKGNSVANYKNAKSAYGDFMTTSRAGTSGVNDNIFTPNQLLRASKTGDKSVNKKQTFLNQGRMQDLGQDAQGIFGRTIGDSGTGIRNIGLNFASGGGLVGASTMGGVPVAGASAAYLAALQQPQTTRALLEILNAGSRGAVATVPMASAYGTKAILDN